MHTMVSMEVRVMAAFYAFSAISVGNRIMDKLKKMKATSKETARTIEELELTEPEKRRLHQLAFIGKIKETSDGRYCIECKDGKHC